MQTVNLIAFGICVAIAFPTGLVLGTLPSQARPSTTIHRLGIAMTVLAGIGIVVGLQAVALAARATADPVDSVRDALECVRRGEFDVRVPVYDGTQIGQLQLGFNAMVEGLAEREKIRETFGAYVDPDVAEHILEDGTNLAGEEVEVTVMFLDIRDFTPFAEKTPADEVVAAINRRDDPRRAADRELLRDDHPELTERTGVALQGKSEPVKLYAPSA